MPTTNFLLYKDNTFSKTMKGEIRDKVKREFNVILPSRKNEMDDENESRIRIAEIVARIRDLLRDNKLLLQALVIYNFFRNFIGACVIAVLFSVIALIFSYTKFGDACIWFSWILLVVYSLPLILSKILIKKHGEYYAKTLYEQFLTF